MDERSLSKSIITSAPNQNREHFEERLERLVPYFGARVLNRVFGISNETEPLQVDMWNSFGNYMDKSYKSQTLFDGASRLEYSSLLLDEKYSFLREIGIDTTLHEIVRDDDPETINWMLDKLTNLYGQSLIYEDMESVAVCVNCDNIIAPSVIRITHCNYCDSDNIRIENRNNLFIDLTDDKLRYLKDKIDLPKKANFINGQFATLPRRAMVTRKRDYGQPLGISGYEDRVLDPKLGLALMPEMVVNKYGLSTITQVQGAATAKNTAPYTALLSPDLSARYIFTSNIPRDINIQEMNTIGRDFFIKYLPVFMLDRAGDVGVPQMEALASEHSKAARKMDNALGYLRTNRGMGVKHTEGAYELSGAIDDIISYDVRRGVLGMRSYIYQELGGSYVDNARNRKSETTMGNLAIVESILREIF